MRAVLVALVLVGCGRSHFDSVPDAAATVTPTSTVSEIAMRGSAACALRDGGAVFCWGQNAHGNLGDRTTTSTLDPVQVQGLPEIAHIATGELTACAVDVDGGLWCWGGNGNGQVGVPGPVDQLLAVNIDAIPVVEDIAMGEWHTCIRGTDGSVWCFGENRNGALGDGTFEPRVGPVQALAQGGQSLAISDEVTCVIETDKSVSCWGRGDFGNLGDGSMASRSTAGPVTNLADVTKLNGGCHRHMCATEGNGTVWCWGLDDNMQLGDGTTETAFIPIQVPGLPGPAVDAGAGVGHSCALLADGRVACWGANEHGQLGNGLVDASTTPVEVFGVNDAKALEVGCSGNCIQREDDSVWCWGEQLGDSRFFTNVPRKIELPEP